MKFDTAAWKWTLYWSDSNGYWHIFDLISPRTIGKLLREIEDDETKIFWG